MPVINIPGYKIKRELGFGGMSQVYLAEQESLQREVALKVMYSHYADIADYKRRFMRDGRAAASLNHRQIVNVYDMGVVDHQFYIAMEYLSGGTLREKIKQGLSPAQSIQITKQIAEALAYSHKQGFVHRDIKPMNILFRDDGYAVLTDFGIAKESGSDNTALTMVGTVLGSPKYMSPEQARGDAVDGRSDLYSLGIVLYEMLTGTVPYDSNSAVDIVMKHLNDPLPELPPRLRQYQFLISKMMAKVPANRPQSADELLGLISTVTSSNTDSSPDTDSTQFLADHPYYQKTSSKKFHFSTKTRLLSAAVIVVSLISSSRFIAADWATLEGLTRLLHGKEQSTDTYTKALPLPAKPPAAEQAPEISGLSAAQYEQGARVNRRINPDSSMAYLEEGLQKYPTDPGLLKLKNELAQERAIRELLRKADHLRAQNLLIYPVGNSALEIYQRVLAADSANAAAKQGIQDIAEHFRTLAIEAFKKRDYTQSLAMVEAGLKAAPRHDALLKLKATVIPQAALEEKRMKSMLAQAEQLLSIFPLTDNELSSAWQKFQTAQQYQKDNPRIKTGLARIAAEYHHLAEQAFAENRFAEAMRLIKKGKQANPGNNDLTQLQERLVAGLSR